MNVLSIVSSKGGVGKTTAAQNIGAAIATFTGRKVLLIDLDPPAGLTKSFGFVGLSRDQPTVADLILNRAILEHVVLKYSYRYNDREFSLDVLPSAMSLVEDQEEIKRHDYFPFSLNRALEQANERVSYDFVIIDCPASISVLTDLALAASQRYYIPLQTDFLGYEGLREFVTYVDRMTAVNPRLRLGGIFSNRFNPSAKRVFSRMVVDSVMEQFKDRFLKTYIRENVALSKAQAAGKHIFNYDSMLNTVSNAAVDYYELMKEIILVRKC